jgi:hypothetical protein
MAFRHSVALIISLLLSNSAWADSLDINPQHPDQYTVAHNDTLWDISAKFLNSPWQWSKLWHNNPQVKNPHLIYPGDVLVFSTVAGNPRLSVSDSSGSKRLYPSIRRSPLDEAIKSIPPDAISQFLNSPKVVGATELESSPYVIDFPGEHLIAGAGNRAYVRSIWQPQTLDYTFYRKGLPYVRPETGEVLGFEAIYIASGILEKDGDPATLTITKSKEELRIGDRLMPSFENQASLNFFPTPPETYISGNIIAVTNGVSQIGRHNIVVIDRGTVDGLKIGHVLSIYQRGKVVNDTFQMEGSVTQVKLPNEFAGSLMVFRVFERVSYALVMEAFQTIHVLDKIQTPN